MVEEVNVTTLTFVQKLSPTTKLTSSQGKNIKTNVPRVRGSPTSPFSNHPILPSQVNKLVMSDRQGPIMEATLLSLVSLLIQFFYSANCYSHGHKESYIGFLVDSIPWTRLRT